MLRNTFVQWCWNSQVETNVQSKCADWAEDYDKNEWDIDSTYEQERY